MWWLGLVVLLVVGPVSLPVVGRCRRVLFVGVVGPAVPGRWRGWDVVRWSGDDWS